TLTNVNKIPLVLSYSCNTGKYQNDECFMETWLRVGFRGAIAAVGATIETGWIEDDYFQRFLFDAAFDSSLTWIAGMLNKAKLRFFQRFGNTPVTRACFETYNLLGLPSVHIYTDTLFTLNPSYPNSIPIGYQTMTVNLGTTRKCLVSLCSKRDTIHQTQYTSTGSVQFSFSASAYDTLILTISGHNIKTHQGLITVQSPDVGVSKLLVPMQVDSGSVITPACSVYNYGTVNANYWVKIRISSFYRDSVYLENHQPSTRLYVSFKPCTLNLRGYNFVSCSTEFTGDLNPSNDKKTDSIFVRVLDVAVTEIIQPVGIVESTATIIPKAIVKNYGNTTVSFSASFKIGTWSNTQPVYNLLPDSGRIINFASWTVGARGSYLVKCSTALSGDQVITNNQLEDSLWIIGDTIPPLPPILISPANNETLQTQVISLVWHKVSDAVLYQLTVNQNKAEYEITDTSYTLELAQGNYNWQVRAKDGAGNWSDWSEIRQFTIRLPEPPGWTQKHPIPSQISNKYVKDGGALVSAGNVLYAFRGNKSNEFYQYLPSSDSWIKKESIPFWYKPGTTTINKKRVGKGASLCWNGNNTIYATKGNGTYEFWAYDTITNQWTFKSYVPSQKPPKGGTSITYLNGKVYVLAGSQKIINQRPENNFFVYHPTTNTWDTLSPAPIDNDYKSWKDGSCLTVIDSLIYALKGNAKHNYFWVYSPN
ncbi:MAG: C25 family cysteine peptidase, partial [candidate division WOR-3 bacterium]|nr:C25 family cysteine peptidase [candidate division WOR-3 bacterium]